MIGTIILCLLSTGAFCGCTRGVLVLASGSAPTPKLTHGSSEAAKRMMRGYLIFSLVILAALALAGAIVSYYELFAGQ